MRRAVSVVSGALFFWRVLSFHQPIVDIRTFGNRNFAIGCFLSFVTGRGTYKQDRYAEDAEKVVGFYRDRGYLRVRVDNPEVRPLEDSPDGRTRHVIVKGEDGKRIYGAVADFIDVRDLYFPWIFNIADAGISVGVAFLLLDSFLTGEEKLVHPTD